MDKYESLDVIGSGSFGLVRKVKRKSDGKILARKEINYVKLSEKEKQQLVAELNILKEIRHPHIVRYYDRHFAQNSGVFYLVMEYCSGGDLRALLNDFIAKDKLIKEEAVWNIFTQIVLALHECHQGYSQRSNKDHHVILHRDLKPDNIFLDGDCNIKLGDFGLSRVLDDPATMFAKTYVGTPYYMSPELINGQPYDAKSDIWALGCVLYEICALKPPFPAQSQAVLFNKILTGSVPRLPSYYSNDLNNVVKSMLQLSPSARPTTTQLLQVDKIHNYTRNLEHQPNLKTKEEELNSRYRVLQEFEVQLKAREDKVRQMEANINEREAALNKLEEDLRARELQLEVREMELKAIHAKLLNTPKKDYDFMDISNLSAPRQTNNTTASTSRLLNMMEEDDDIPSPFIKRYPTIA
ncbi:never in mitosis gene a-related expressed kinase 2 [Basidiobolus meristosporus CBS 931.73]|uniref:non-specific serine/threonine protein kinase n=1 Tax=Basidiobolus meristosporus CBS 931.73 TaxID=1314790 RepID=A0A1Y1YX39_9FUNG|nr:never in mitosis gene a-related expressed kinase 2 [Basidiobolus meristosporus CBS 931.73]|eukprot:ORY02602.1 never in mitosis gene a-related expressed kinase 2 [Basidiobolus meristosporus CBS 931.73]